MAHFNFRLTGLTPLLMCADDIALSDHLTAWRKDPANSGQSRPGDDRSPAWTWKTRVYSDGVRLVIPSDNLMSCLRKTGAEFKMRGQTTYKSATQSDLFVRESPALLIDGEEVSAEAINVIRGSFAEHVTAVKRLGFDLYTKRAKVGVSKHIRVRPRFDNWVAEGEIKIIGTSPDINADILSKIFSRAGRNGIGDWRPSSPKSPGPFGQFSADIEQID
jgi:hypothetical protein